MKLQIISVGKKNQPELEKLIIEYQKRISVFTSISWKILKTSSLPLHLAINKESEDILKVIPEKSIVWLLDEAGLQLNNYDLAKNLQQTLQQKYNELVVVIGGPYGVSQQLKSRADFTWSLSKLVFPHLLVRLILIEQLYRSSEIIKNSGYHHS
jgi:23S rRNA (pseudouridine1915-N3)-methyltransferase